MVSESQLDFFVNCYKPKYALSKLTLLHNVPQREQRSCEVKLRMICMSRQCWMQMIVVDYSSLRLEAYNKKKVP